MRRLLVSVAAVAAALAITACGNKEAETLHGTTEGAYLDLGGMKYQVQISRLLNPNDPEDRGYLVDLPAGQDLGTDDEWFAVFMRVENPTDSPQPVADQYEIVDTEDNKYRPVQFGPKNVFVYRARTVGAEQVLPLPDSPAGQASIQGAMLLFKIPYKNLENRPLELRIPAPAGTTDEVGTIDLDV
jgi:hypothetical protein